jgi:hypothetical protein
MISVAGGRLTLLNLQVELEVPPLEAIPAASWSLIASQRAELIRLEGCNLSIRNLGVGRAALHPDVALLMGSIAPRDLAEGRIDLEDCVLRGEANWLRVADAQPLHVTWNNGLLAISERAVNLAPRTMSDRPPGALRLDLRHLTAAVAGGLVRLPSPQDFPLYRALEVDCADSIWLGHNEPFVTQLGAVGSGDLRGSLAWKGGRNFFLGFPVMYGRAGDRSASPLSSLSFAQWQGQWGAPQEKQLTRADFVELPELARPFHGHLVEDYALDDQAWDNPALGGASDSQDAGVLAAGLTSGGNAPARLAPETRAALDAIP